MANIMSLKTIMNKPSRNGFDLSTKRNFTAKCGELLPVWSSEVIPGDTYKINLRSFTRTAPLNTAAFARMREYWDFYFVPYHVLWNRANEVLSQMDFNQQHATSLSDMPDAFTGELPYLTTEQIGAYINNMSKLETLVGKNYFGYKRSTLSVKLLEYLQYGNFESYDSGQENPVDLPYNLDMNIMGLLAYQKIYSDYFRNQQWEKPNPSTFNCDYMNGSSGMNVNIPSSTTDPFYTNFNMFDLRYCDWQKDLYHGVLPQPQYGDTAVVPLDGIPTIRWSANGEGTPATTGPLAVTVRGTALTNESGNIVGMNGGSSGLFVASGFDKNYSPNTSQAVWDSSSGLSILALRQYEFLQKWKEIAQCGDQDYKGITKRIWNVDVPNGLSDKCQYLGGVASSLDINEVVNNNITDQNAATIAGKCAGVSDGNINFNSDGQYGIIMCIYHCMPLVDYTIDYTSPAFTRVNAEDFANPVFDRVGMQPVSTANILNSVPAGKPSPDPSMPFNIGYAPRYIDYKTAIDLSFGSFKRELQNWVLSYNAVSMQESLGFETVGTGDPNVPSPTTNQLNCNYTFFKVNPNLVDPIFVLKATSEMKTDQFWVSSFFDVKAVRNLDTDGLPY